MALQSTTALATITLQAATPSVTFSSIPNTYRDLILTIDGSLSGTVRLRFNGDEGSNYSFVSAAGNNNNAPYSVSGTTTFINPSPDFGVNTQFDTRFQIIDYSATDKHKTVLARHGMSAQSPNMVAARWANTNAIITVEVSTATNSYAAGTIFCLYGRIA